MDQNYGSQRGYLLSTPRWSESAAERLGVRAPQGMRIPKPLEGVFSPLLDEPPPRREGRLLALLGGFLVALMAAACKTFVVIVVDSKRHNTAKISTF